MAAKKPHVSSFRIISRSEIPPVKTRVSSLRIYEKGDPHRGYVVYGHYHPVTDELFYIGSGSAERAYYEEGRSRKWWEYVLLQCPGGKHAVKILHILPTRKEAYEVEADLITQLQPLTNVVYRKVPQPVNSPSESIPQPSNTIF